MVRSLPYEFFSELSKDLVYIRHLVTLFIGPTIRWTDCDQDIFYANEWYEKKSISFDAANFSITPQADSISFSISNVDKFFSDLILNQDIRGKEAWIERVCLDNNLQIIGAASMMYLGFLDNIKVDRKIGNVKIYNHMIKWKTPTPRRDHSPNCPWVFKGTECGYSGTETWCDYTTERCKQFNNRINFGGFAHISKMAQKEIWWGTKQKIWNSRV